jgi:hypothetical protein
MEIAFNKTAFRHGISEVDIGIGTLIFGTILPIMELRCSYEN